MDEENNLPKIIEPNIDDLGDTQVALFKPNQQRFLHMYLSGGYKISEMAMVLNLTEQTLRGWLRKPEIKKAITDFQSQENDIVNQSLKAMRSKAVTRLYELMDSPIDGVALTAVDRVLDRTGHKPSVKKEIDINVKTFEERLVELDEDFIDADFTIKEQE